MPNHKADLSKLSMHQLSLITGLAYQTVKRRLSGLDPVDKDGRTLFFSAPAALRTIYGKPLSERERLDKARADQTEFALAAARGEFIPATDVALTFNEAMQIIASTMDAVPGRLAQQVAGMDSAAEIRQLLLSEIRRGRQQAADRLSAYLDGCSK